MTYTKVKEYCFQHSQSCQGFVSYKNKIKYHQNFFLNVKIFTCCKSPTVFCYGRKTQVAILILDHQSFSAVDQELLFSKINIHIDIIHADIINTSYLEISKASESFVLIMFQEIYSIFQSHVRYARWLASCNLLSNEMRNLDGLY